MVSTSARLWIINLVQASGAADAPAVPPIPPAAAVPPAPPVPDVPPALPPAPPEPPLPPTPAKSGGSEPGEQETPEVTAKNMKAAANPNPATVAVRSPTGREMMLRLPEVCIGPPRVWVVILPLS
jgi:hypothetical protein